MDGVDWEKPQLRVCEFRGSTENNIVLQSRTPDGLIDDITVIHDPDDTEWPLKALYWDSGRDTADEPRGIYAARSADGQTVFLKAVNPTGNEIEAAVRLDGDWMPRTATMQLIAPGGETVKNSLEEPDNIRAVAAGATVEDRIVRFTMPPLSAGVVRVTP